MLQSCFLCRDTDRCRIGMTNGKREEEAARRTHPAEEEQEKVGRRSRCTNYTRERGRERDRDGPFLIAALGLIDRASQAGSLRAFVGISGILHPFHKPGMEWSYLYE